MEIELSKDTERIIKEISEKTGLYEKEIFLRAIKCYVRNIEEFPLKDELKAWNDASDEDFASFE
jgi:hypothetical protein